MKGRERENEQSGHLENVRQEEAGERVEKGVRQMQSELSEEQVREQRVIYQRVKARHHRREREGRSSISFC